MRKGQQQIIDKVCKWENEKKTKISPSLKEILFDESYPVWFYSYIYIIVTSSEAEEEKLLHVDKTWYILSDLRKNQQYINKYSPIKYASYSQIKDITIENIEVYDFFVESVGYNYIMINTLLEDIGMEELQRIYTYIQTLEDESITKGDIVYHSVFGNSYRSVAKNICDIIIGNYNKDSVTVDYIRSYYEYIISTYGGPYNPNNTVKDTIYTEYQKFIYKCTKFFKNNICFTDAKAANFSYNEYIKSKINYHWGIIIKGMCNEKWQKNTRMYYTYQKNFIPEEHRGNFKLLTAFTGMEISASIPSYTFAYKITDKGVTLYFRYNSKVTIREQYNGKVIDYVPCSNKKESLIVWLTDEGKIYTKSRDRWHPLSIKQLSKYSFVCKNNKFYNHHFSNFLNLLYEQLVSKNAFVVKDIWKSVKDGTFLVPVSFEDVINSHDKKQLMIKYKIPLNFNKIDVNLSYIIAKCNRYVDENSFKILLNYKDADILKRAAITTNACFRYNYSFYSRQLNGVKINGVKIFLITYISEKIINEQAVEEYKKRMNVESNEAEAGLRQLITDYVNTQIYAKKKINLKIKSWKKLNDAHNTTIRETNVSAIKKDKGKKITIPKNTRFERLRKILPKDFEWIKNKERLLLEAQLQNNCVYSYLDSINNDNCAIYSLWYKPESCRYTIEFYSDSKGNYIINQIHRARNQGSTPDVRTYVNGFINKEQNEIKNAC